LVQITTHVKKSNHKLSCFFFIASFLRLASNLVSASRSIVFWYSSLLHSFGWKWTVN